MLISSGGHEQPKGFSVTAAGGWHHNLLLKQAALDIKLTRLKLVVANERLGTLALFVAVCKLPGARLRHTQLQARTATLHSCFPNRDSLAEPPLGLHSGT